MGIYLYTEIKPGIGVIPGSGGRTGKKSVIQILFKNIYNSNSYHGYNFNPGLSCNCIADHF
jgi:hypothetical protein